MNTNTDTLKLQYLYYLKRMGHSYTKPLKEFVPSTQLELPQNLQKLSDAVRSCHLCQLAKTRLNTVFGEGNESAKLMFVGEGPGESEDKSGRPFVGKAGELLTKMIENAIGVQRESVYIANILKCRPPGNRVPTKDEASTCISYLHKQIEIINPKIIVALGATALNSLAKKEYPIMKIRGSVMEYEGAKLVPTFHPSFLLRNPSAKKEAYADMLLIKTLLDGLES